MDGVDDEDEVLAAIALSLGKLMPYVGGPKHIFALLAPLEMLLAVGKFNCFDSVSNCFSFFYNIFCSCL